MDHSERYARIESERRFLLGAPPPNLGQTPPRRIEDLYITGSRLRLRKVTASNGDVEYKLSQKIDRDASHRLVTSLYLAPYEYTRLAQLAGKRILKRRYHTRWNDREFGIDVFDGALAGLVLAEVEAESNDRLDALPPPPLAHVEVTHRVEFTGGHLAVAVPGAALALARSLLPQSRSTTQPPALLIRMLHAEDPVIIAGAFRAMGWNKPESQYRRYLQEQAAGDRVVLVAWYNADFAGYVTIVWSPDYTPFRSARIPEIQDLNVVTALRRRGIATALLDEAEALIARRSPLAGIGVGLHSGYNAAQRFYGLRGYVPDGHGVAHGSHFVQDGELMPFDDDLVLHLTKPI